MSPNISEKQKAGNDQKLRPQTFFFLIDAFQKPATRVSGRSPKDAKPRHYMQMLFIISQAAQILPWSGCRSPQQLPSKVYAQGFLISSQRAAAIAAALTTAVGVVEHQLGGLHMLPRRLPEPGRLCSVHIRRRSPSLRRAAFLGMETVEKLRWCWSFGEGRGRREANICV